MLRFVQVALQASLLHRAVAVTVSGRLSETGVHLDWSGNVEGAAAVATYVSEHDGWGKLWLKAFPTETAKDAIYVAGFLEGFVTKDAIENSYANCYGDWFVDGSPKSVNSTAVFDFLEENLAFVLTQGQEAESGFWGYLPLIVSQLRGLAAGLQAAGSHLGFREMLFLNADGDLEELVPMLGRPTHRDRCSALVKLLPDHSDIFLGHTTWDHYSMMVRSLKTYDFNFKGWPHSTVSFSASPGFLTSLDDFYLTSSGLAVIETTNGIRDPSLYSLIKPDSVLFWMRVLVANALATDTSSWVELYVTSQSGTYNNQWMIVDTKLFRPNQQLQPFTFVVLETMPGLVRHADMTQHLESEGYWASYNVPFFPEVYKYSGNPLPSTHETCPRARIFRDQQRNVVDMESFKRVMRYNDWQHNALSLDNACNAVASRCDLNNMSSADWQLDGAIDAKVTNIQMAKQLVFHAQQGPTHDQQPPFDWSSIPRERWLSHSGQPSRFEFAWTRFGPLEEIVFLPEAVSALTLAPWVLGVAAAMSLRFCRVERSQVTTPLLHSDRIA